MTNIKKKLKAKYGGLLDYFESNIGEIEIVGTKKFGYFVHPKGKLFADQALSTLPAYDVEGIALFLQGVTQSERIRRCFNGKD